MPATAFASPGELALVALVLLVAEAVYVLLGFGAGLIAVGALALILPEVRDVVVILLLVSLPAELYVVASSWRHVRWRRVLAVCAGIVVGVPLGTVALSWGEPHLLLVLLGAFLVVVGLLFLTVPDRRSVRWPPSAAPLVGLVSGLLGGLFGTSGPPLILYYQLEGADKASFRANLMAVFMLITLVRTPTYALAGLITRERLLSALVVLPIVLLGALVGNRIHLRLAEPTFRRLVSAALVAIGLLLLAQRVV